ncbi:MAG: hypothetical protein M0D55_08500 [Elusimicrobiota bacterium]|nr:MAG: hypothetical protein M0D55_08500 [Elusimicrobiota bacterium]
MTEIKLTFDLTFTRRFLSRAGAIAIMLCAVPELDSESVTLSTYYPAPSGVYTNMITTGNTYLARDGGNVGVGTTAPAVKLHVVGDVQANHIKFPGVGGNSGAAGDYYGIYQEAGAWSGAYPDLRVQYHTGIKYDAYYGYGGHRFYTGYDGSTTPSGAGAVTGNGPTLTVNDGVRSSVAMIYNGPACTATPYAFGVVACPGGTYATYTTGVFVALQYGSATTDPTGTMLCCPCPVGGCTL